MAISEEFDNLHAEYVTMKANADIAYDRAQPNGSVHVGKAVQMSGASEVRLSQTGGEIFGTLSRVEPDGKCTIQDAGYAEVPVTGVPTYTALANGAIGGATPGSVTVAGAAPALGAIRTARLIKPSDTAGKVYIKL